MHSRAVLVFALAASSAALPAARAGDLVPLGPEFVVTSLTANTQKQPWMACRDNGDFVLSYSSLGAESVFSTLQGRSLMMFGAGIELFEVGVPAQLAGKTLAECAIGASFGINVIAVQQDGEIQPNPSPTTPLPPRAELLLVGTHEQRQKFARTFG